MIVFSCVDLYTLEKRIIYNYSFKEEYLLGQMEKLKHDKRKLRDLFEEELSQKKFQVFIPLPPLSGEFSTVCGNCLNDFGLYDVIA